MCSFCTALSEHSPIPTYKVTKYRAKFQLLLKNFAKQKKDCTFALGKMAEWSNAPVLKTDDLRGSGGSNPSLSAQESLSNKFLVRQALMIYIGIPIAIPIYLSF